MDHLGKEEGIKEEFPDEKLLCAISAHSDQDTPWYSDMENFLSSDVMPPKLQSSYQRKKFLNDVKNYYWDSRLCSKSAAIMSSADACQKIRQDKLSINATHPRVVDITEPREPLTRYWKSGSTGQQFTEMHFRWQKLVMCANEWAE